MKIHRATNGFVLQPYDHRAADIVVSDASLKGGPSVVYYQPSSDNKPGWRIYLEVDVEAADEA